VPNGKRIWVIEMYLLFPYLGKLGDTHEEHAQANEEHAETDWATPIENKPKFHDLLLLLEKSVGH
jgi:hypothetical protein